MLRCLLSCCGGKTDQRRSILASIAVPSGLSLLLAIGALVHLSSKLVDSENQIRMLEDMLRERDAAMRQKASDSQQQSDQIAALSMAKLQCDDTLQRRVQESLKLKEDKAKLHEELQSCASNEQAVSKYAAELEARLWSCELDHNHTRSYAQQTEDDLSKCQQALKDSAHAVECCDSNPMCNLCRLRR